MSDGEVFAALLASARSGEPWAWQHLFGSLSPAVAGYARVQGVRDVDDVVSEVFIGVFRGIADFVGTETQFRSWVFVIAHRRIIDDRRRRGRDEMATRLGRQPVREALTADGEGQALDAVGRARTVALIERLVPDQRDVLLLRIVGDLTIEQIADVLDKSVGAVKALQRRGLGALRKILDREGVPL